MNRKALAGVTAVAALSGLLGGGLSAWLLRGGDAFAQGEAGQVLRGKRVVAEEFKLVDGTGKERAAIYLQPNGAAAFVLHGTKQNDRLWLVVDDKDQPRVTLRDADNKPRAEIVVNESGCPYVNLQDKDGTDRIVLQIQDDGCPYIYLNDKEEANRLVQAVLKDGSPQILFKEKGGKVQLRLPK